MRLVILESPYAGDVELNLRYARACMKDCLSRGEAPFASHLLYTQPGVLDDSVPEERSLGIRAGYDWGAAASTCVVYTDLGISPGMMHAIEHVSGRKNVEFRVLPADRMAEVRASGEYLVTKIRESLCEQPAEEEVVLHSDLGTPILVRRSGVFTQDGDRRSGLRLHNRGRWLTLNADEVSGTWTFDSQESADKVMQRIREICPGALK